jgi:hypothetical protein
MGLFYKKIKIPEYRYATLYELKYRFKDINLPEVEIANAIKIF